MRRRLKRPAAIAVLVTVAVAFLVVDLLSKMVVRGELDAGESLPFIPGLLEIRLTFNDGAAFGMFGGGGIFLIVIALAVTCVVIVHTVMVKKHAWLEIIAKALVVAGGLGNAIDRIGDGQVTDFFNFLFVDFAIFNVADSCLTCGVALWIFWMLISSFRFGASSDNGGTRNPKKAKLIESHYQGKNNSSECNEVGWR